MAFEDEKERLLQEVETAVSRDHIERLLDAAQPWLNKLSAREHEELLDGVTDHYSRCPK